MQPRFDFLASKAGIFLAHLTSPFGDCHLGMTNVVKSNRGEEPCTPLQKFSWVFEFSWESHEILKRKWHSHENFPILMRISHELFCSWESHFSHENWKLIRMSWDSHEILMRKWHSHEIFSWAFLLVRISFFSRALKAHESLMRFSWENLLTKNLFLLFLMTVSCNFLDHEILIENVVSRVFSIPRKSKYSMHARCVSERKPFRSAFFF